MRPRRWTSTISSGWSAGGGRDILVDTGFNAEEAKARCRRLTLNPVDALAQFGVSADTIKDVIVTHLHYDHAGNLDRFPTRGFICRTAR